MILYIKPSTQQLHSEVFFSFSANVLRVVVKPNTVLQLHPQIYWYPHSGPELWLHVRGR